MKFNKTSARMIYTAILMWSFFDTAWGLVIDTPWCPVFDMPRHPYIYTLTFIIFKVLLTFTKSPVQLKCIRCMSYSPASHFVHFHQPTSNWWSDPFLNRHFLYYIKKQVNFKQCNAMDNNKGRLKLPNIIYICSLYMMHLFYDCLI